jgi:hypothetical protein
VILAASKSQRQMIQRMGRVLRRKPDERLARFAILFIEGSSEDPSRGAHGDFLDEVTSVADHVEVFPVGASRDDICSYLNEFTASGEVVTASGPPAADIGLTPTKRKRRASSSGSQASPTQPVPNAECNATTLPATGEMTIGRVKRLFKSAGIANAPRRAPLGSALFRLGDVPDDVLVAALQRARTAEQLEAVARGADPDVMRAANGARSEQRNQALLHEYRSAHGEAMFRRFGVELGELLTDLRDDAGINDVALRRAVRGSHDPREIAHLARINRSLRAEPVAPSSPLSVRPGAPTRPPSASKVKKRYCKACGLIEEGCRC